MGIKWVSTATESQELLGRPLNPCCRCHPKPTKYVKTCSLALRSLDVDSLDAEAVAVVVVVV